jgi:hypothetical protein
LDTAMLSARGSGPRYRASPERRCPPAMVAAARELGCVLLATSPPQDMRQRTAMLALWRCVRAGCVLFSKAHSLRPRLSHTHSQAGLLFAVALQGQGKERRRAGMRSSGLPAVVAACSDAVPS